MCKAAVCVLNYLNYKETMDCVDSILQQKGCTYQIIVVDNGSDNDSYSSLKEKYSGNRQVTVLRANRNYGFAKGHNIGIHYARKHFGADYVLLLNSDIILAEENYIAKMINADEDNVGVLGSRIVMRDGREYRFEKQYTAFPATLYRYMQLFFYCKGAYKIADYFERSAKKRYVSEDVLHGSAFMLTPDFFRYYTGLYDKTFLYEEETLLYLNCRRCGLIEKRVNETYVVHKGGQSTKLFYGGKLSQTEKYIFRAYKYVLLESIRDYLSGRNLCRTGAESISRTV